MRDEGTSHHYQLFGITLSFSQEVRPVMAPLAGLQGSYGTAGPPVVLAVAPGLPPRGDHLPGVSAHVRRRLRTNIERRQAATPTSSPPTGTGGDLHESPRPAPGTTHRRGPTTRTRRTPQARAVVYRHVRGSIDHARLGHAA